MKTLSRAELEKSLRQGLEPLYLLVGPERYLRSAAAREITEAALSTTLIRDFNEAGFSLLTDSVRSAVAAAEQLPMMSDRRVVRVRDFARLRDADEDVLIAYLANPSPSTVMIFTADDLDKRKKSTKALLDACTVVDFSPLKDSEAKAWARSYLKSLKSAADDQVLSEIVNLVGTDIQTLANELDKLASAAVDTGRITAELVDELIGRTRELSNFELGDHLLSNNRKRALETLYRLLDDGAEPVMLIGLIAGNYHRLALGKHLLTRGGREEVFRNVSMPPFKRDAYITTLQRSDAKKIARGIQLTAAADLAIKTSQATPRLQLELLVCELAS
ncbi:MAG TPA: DNA polymerase III subunit delta [Pyrinomonadaceae bacterium]|jgi:DNA polymerase-3 subunit delta|nr:DNA polymerase III subunit delta [Pyrinomonadaceae bacterium]